MTSFKDHSWRLSYKTSGLRPVSILHDFYIPVIRRAVRYDRVAGYFRSSSLAAASQGFTAFAAHNGKMRLIAGVDLEPADVEAILQGETARLSSELSKELGQPEDQRLEGESWGIALLASLVQKGVLEIKVALRIHVETGEALPVDSDDDGYVHEKWAIFTDGEGNRIYIAGSLNESKTALKLNAENIDVHCDWKSEDSFQRADEAEADFETLWNNAHPAFRVLPIPEAIRQQIIRFAGRLPERPIEIDGTSAAPVAAKPSAQEWLAFAFIKDAPKLPKGQYLGIETAPIVPWPHQRIVARRLVDSWPLSWMLCDEVGLGKTIETGLALRSLYLSGFVRRVLIAAPASIAPQWQREMAEKFFLPFSRAVTGPKLRHRRIFPIEEEYSATSIGSPDLNIVSTGLLVRENRQADLAKALDWDIVLLDEAHYARRANPNNWADRPPEWNKLFKVAKNLLRAKSKSVWLATATPVQIDPIEAIDLASLCRRLGPFGLESQVALGFYELLGKLRRSEKVEDLEWLFLARIVQHVFNCDPAISDFIRATLLRGRDRRDLERWLGSLNESPGAPPAPAKRAVIKLLFSVSPLSRVMMRHNRGLLQKYREHGKLSGNLARRQVHLPPIQLNAEEQAVYDLFEPYCRELAEQVKTHSQQRTAVGFMLSFFNLRFSSSYKAILDTLIRRRDKVGAALEHRLTKPEFPDEDLEELVDQDNESSSDELTAAGLFGRNEADLKWEYAKLSDLVESLTPLAQKQSPKVRALLNMLQQRALPEGRVRQMVVFTRFYDTLTDIQSWIERSATSIRIGVFSGPRCAFIDPQTLAWKRSNREEVKRRFVSGYIDVLLCTDAAAEGLNLQTADLLVNFDLPWNPMKVEQRIGRIDRIAQRHDVIHVANFAYPDTVEDEVYVRLQQRIAGAEDVVGTQQVIVLPIIPSDLRELAAGKLTSEQLEARVKERLTLAKARTASMDLTPDELYDLYQYLDDEFTKEPLPITLEDIFSVLEGSKFLRDLGSEILETEFGKALVIRGIPDQEAFVLTVSRELFERGLRDRSEPLHFATWGDPAFDCLLEFIVSSASLPPGVRKIEETVLDGQTTLVGWMVSTTSGVELITRFDQLASARPEKSIQNEVNIEAELINYAKQLNQHAKKLGNVEAVALRAAEIHRKTHLLIAASLLSCVPKDASIADLSEYLPDQTRTLKSGKLDTADVQAERLHGVLQTSGSAVMIPGFYQAFLANTLRKERLALKKARKGTEDSEIPLYELAERIAKAARY